MAKNLIICCDGTNNQFGKENTNVVRLVQVLENDPRKQMIHYDPGIGTMPEPGFVTPVGKWVSAKVIGLGFGGGLARKIGSAYQFLMDNYESGDAIFLFGFSRGAYTARALAGILLNFGLLPPGGSSLVPYVVRYAREVNRLKWWTSEEKRKDYWEFIKEFRKTFARTDVVAGRGTRSVAINFLGLWDTVSSVGWVWEPVHYPSTTSNPAVIAVRHAVSLDEHRAFFRQNLWSKPKEGTTDLKEIWFPGVHSDVGGGYPESDGGLWRAPFLWMLREARQAGVLIHSEKVREVLKKNSCRGAAWSGDMHNSLTWKWWLAEIFPKMSYNFKTGRTLPRMNLFSGRYIPKGAEIHRSALRRIRRKELNYDPANLSSSFKEHVKGLGRVPETLVYANVPD